MKEKRSGNYGIPEYKRTAEEQQEIDKHPCGRCPFATFTGNKVKCGHGKMTYVGCEYARE